jgi:hypothetical protein
VSHWADERTREANYDDRAAADKRQVGPRLRGVSLLQGVPAPPALDDDGQAGSAGYRPDDEEFAWPTTPR